MEEQQYINNKMDKKLEKIILGIFTVFSLGEFVSSLLLNWNIFFKEIIAVTIILAWIACIKGYWDFAVRAVIISFLVWLNFTIYAVHATSFTSMLSTMFAVIVLLGIFSSSVIIYVGVGFTTVIFLYHVLVVKTVDLSTANDVIRAVLHILSAYVVSFVTWITIRTRMETRELLIDNIRELKSVEQSKDDFVVNISHEIRTPINAVCGMSEAILQENLPVSVRSDIIDIQTAGRNLLATVSNILDFSELESGKMELAEENYNITSTITDIINMAVTLENGKNIELIVDCDASLPCNLVGDELKLRRIMMNLLDNAYKFTKEGGIVLRISSRREEYGINLIVSVKDSGIGMSRADMEKIFNSFSQLDARRNREEGGIGLGLAITQALVQNMGGFLNVESNPGKGTEFQFTIPQKILDETPIVSIKNRTHIYAACYINMSKYNYSVVREGYENCIIHIVEQFGIMFRMCRNLNELKRRIEIENFSHVFIAWEEYCEDREFFEKLAKELMVVLIMDYGQETLVGSSMLRIYKPFTVLSIAAVFNGQRVVQREELHNESRHRFIAPEAKVLVVDDNAMNLKVMARLLLPYRIKVITALSGKEALEKVNLMEYDCVFMDHMMPEMDGVETLHKMRQKPGAYFQSLPIIAFTANAIGGAREMFMEEGFDDFIAKPIELSVLERMLRRYIPAQKQMVVEETDLRGAYGDEAEISGGEHFSHSQSTVAPAGVETSEEQSKQSEEQGLKALELAGINVKLALSYCGDREGLRDIVRMYHSQGEERNSQLNELYKEENWKNYAIAVHALKSNSKGIGAEELAELALNLEMAGKENRADYILEHHEELLEKHNALLQALAVNAFIYPEGYHDPVSEDDDMEESAEEALEEADTGFVQEQMARLREKIDNYESEGIDEILGELAKCIYHEMKMNEMTKEIKSRVDEFDFLGASDILDSWAEKITKGMK